jgi:putative alpha-1,2-mannosidase
MSSWYVLSSIGLYPQCPGRPIFDICSPVFEEVSINVGNGKTFVIEARNVSAQNKYIQSATLNGKPRNQAWINHSDIVQGGKLVFQMGSRPNKDWGSASNVRPPSTSTPIQ